MPVHFKIATHGADPLARQSSTSDPTDILSSTWGKKTTTHRCQELLQSSFNGREEDFSRIYPSTNGFVNTIISAYNQHHHLIIRPDDVWMSILSQFSLYVNAHAEELRSHFVEHEGQKELLVTAEGSRYTVNFGHMAKQMTELIDEHLIDKELKSWILPDFSTTTHNDTVICAVFMMSTLKAYFTYSFLTMFCGIPSVTLEGEKTDWEKLLSRTNKLAEFGAEPEAWARLLRPILTRFVQAFDGQPDIDFWAKVCHYKNFGSGPTYLCGWITAFCVWNKDGKWQGPSLGKWQGPSLTGPEPTVNWSPKVTSLVMDGVQYTNIDSNSVPHGFCEVDVKLDDNGKKFECIMVSGHLAMSVDGDIHDTVRPSPAWFMFIKEICSQTT